LRIRENERSCRFRLARREKFAFFAPMTFSFRSRLATGCQAFLLMLAASLAVPAIATAKTRAHAADTSESTPFKGAIVMDAASGRVLVDDRADEVSPPASMTKLMTFAVLHDKLADGTIKLDTMVQIDRSDAKMGGTEVWLDPRETFSVEDLVYAMMIQSANDAAHALARVSAGSAPGFVELMNAKARELGMTHTTFRSPHGLPPSSRKVADGDLTTPRDFALLCRYLLLHTDVLKYTSVRERDFAPQRPKGPVHMENHNKLLGKVAGVDGLKTGYTAGAGYCLSATAERNGRRVIVVIMGAMGPGGKADFGRARDIKATELMEKGFAALPAGTSDFAQERAKYVTPPVIPLDGPASAPATGNATPTATAPAGPSIKLTLPKR
jgi:D-alanyl-D-alanine carboxypeptidase (penicillin-binding protein 5/6)